MWAAHDEDLVELRRVMSNNIYAYTTSTDGSYPEYLSVNANEDGTVEITVRSPRKADGSCGDTATIKLTAKQFDEFVVAIQK